MDNDTIYSSFLDFFCVNMNSSHINAGKRAGLLVLKAGRKAAVLPRKERSSFCHKERREYSTVLQQYIASACLSKPREYLKPNCCCCCCVFFLFLNEILKLLKQAWRLEIKLHWVSTVSALLLLMGTRHKASLLTGTNCLSGSLLLNTPVASEHLVLTLNLIKQPEVFICWPNSFRLILINVLLNLSRWH